MAKHNNASFDLEFNDSSFFNMYFDDMPTFNTGMQELTAVYSSDHNKLKNRDIDDQHPMSAITGLVAALNLKQDSLIAGNGIVIEDSYIRLDDLILNCGTSTTVI